MADSIAFGGFALNRSSRIHFLTVITGSGSGIVGIVPSVSQVNNTTDGQPVGDTDGLNYTVAVTGSNFTGAQGVSFGGLWATSVHVVSDTLITCIPPSGTLGTKTVVVANANNSGSLANGWRYWDPSALTKTLWLRETRSTSGNDVTSWTDKSGNGRDVTPASVNPKVGQTLNAQPTVEWQAVQNQYMQRAAVPTCTVGDLWTSAAGTTWVVVNVKDVYGDATAAYYQDGIIGDVPTGGNTGITMRRSSDSYVAGHYVWDGSEHTTYRQTPLNSWVVIEAIHSAGTAYVRINSGTQASTSAGTMLDTTYNVYIAAGWDNLSGGRTRTMSGSLAEVVTLNSAIDSQTAAYFRSYAATRYNITSSYPTITSVSNPMAHAVGDTEGLYRVAVTGSNLLGTHGVKFGNSWGKYVDVESNTVLTVAVPSGTAGLADVVVANLASSGTQANGWRYWDPTQMGKKTGWWRETFTQESGASAGQIALWTDKTSNGRNLGHVANKAPTTGSTLGTQNQATIDFDYIAVQYLTGSTISTYINSSTYVAYTIGKYDAVFSNNPDASWYVNTALWADSGGYLGLQARSTGPTAKTYNWDANADTAGTLINTGSWYIWESRHVSGVVSYKTHLTYSEMTASSGDTQVVGGTLYVGNSSIDNLSGSITELLFTNEALDDQQRDYYFDYAVTRYQFDTPFDPAKSISFSGWWVGDDYNASTGLWKSRDSWYGSSGLTNRNFYQGTSANRPASTYTVNGHAGVDFDGVNDYLSSSVATSNFISSNAWTFWCVFEMDAISANVQPYAAAGFMVDSNPSSAWDVGVGSFAGTVGKATVNAYDGSEHNVFAPVTVNKTRRYLMEARMENGRLYCRLNNGPENRTAQGSISGLSNTVVCGRDYNGGGVYMDGRIWEMGVASYVVSASVRQQMRDYLMKKYLVLSGTRGEGTDYSCWFQAPYAGSPWSGTPSANSSTNFKLSEATNPPSVGVALNGYNTADFDGVNDVLTFATTPIALPTLLGVNGWSFVGLINPDVLSADAGNFANNTVWSSTGQYVAIEVFSNSARLLQYNNAGSVVTTVTATGLTAGQWSLIQARWTGTVDGKIEIRINNGAWASATQTEIGGAGDGFKIGANYNASLYFFDGKMAELRWTPRAMHRQEFDSIRGEINSRYNLSI